MENQNDNKLDELNETSLDEYELTESNLEGEESEDIPNLQENLDEVQQSENSEQSDENFPVDVEETEESVDSEENEEKNSAENSIGENSEENNQQNEFTDSSEEEDNEEAKDDNDDDEDVAEDNFETSDPNNENIEEKENNSFEETSEELQAEESDPDFAENLTEDGKVEPEIPSISNVKTAEQETIEAQEITFQQPEISTFEPSSDVEENTGQYSNVPVQNMPITLTFETMRQNISLGELETIQPGYIFEGSNITEKPVTICANNTPIGYGEILDIEGKIGIRVIEFFNK